MSDNYDDLLYLPHPTSKTHPRMSRQDRAAQFAPFAALTGYEAVVKETARLTEERPMLTEDEVAELDIRLRLAMDLDTEVTVIWFQPDDKKVAEAMSPLRAGSGKQMNSCTSSPWRTERRSPSRRSPPSTVRSSITQAERGNRIFGCGFFSPRHCPIKPFCDLLFWHGRRNTPCR